MKQKEFIDQKNSFNDLTQNGKVFVEYIWIDSALGIFSKTHTLGKKIICVADAHYKVCLSRSMVGSSVCVLSTPLVFINETLTSYSRESTPITMKPLVVNMSDVLSS